MRYFSHKSTNWRRGLYTLCFFSLCLIDWIKVSLNGRAQLAATNATGIVVAIIILSSFSLKSFSHHIYVVWIAMCIILLPLGIKIALIHIPYKGQVVTAAINIALYGFILIRLFFLYFFEKKAISFKLTLFLNWLLMLVLMSLSINENIWPIWYIAVFGSFYLTEFDSKAENTIYTSVVDGVILGFFIIQGIALLFRPYDAVRYSGLYINPNFNSLFYLMTYSALLSKWFWLKTEGKNNWLKILTYLLAGSMYGFCLFTGSKTVMLAMIIITLPFSVLSIRHSKSKSLTFIGRWCILGLVGILSIPMVYFAIRYSPTIHLHPLYFEGEYSPDKIQPGEPRDSEKYISFDTAIKENLGRWFYGIPKIEELINPVFVLKVKAAELEEQTEPNYIYTNDDPDPGTNPLRLRYEIHKYYFSQLNFVGHKNDYIGAPINSLYTAPHAHNLFIQMAFLYGIPAGILFIVMVMSFVPGCLKLIKLGYEFKACVISSFVLAFVVFGFFEIDWMCGQLPFTLFFMLFRGILRKKSN